VEGSCEHDNDSIKCLGNSSVSAELAAFQEGLSSMELLHPTGDIGVQILTMYQVMCNIKE
jgi:hypothetical protein